MTRPPLLGLLAALVISTWAAPGAALVPPAACADGTDEEARAKFLDALVEHASWCGEKGLGVERARVLERVLALHPEHAGARRALGFRIDRDGVWHPPRMPPPRRDVDEPDVKAEAARRFGELCAEYLARWTAVLEDPSASDEAVRAAEDEILGLDPENATVHRRRGEVLVDGRWLLRESSEAEQRRARMSAAIARAHALVPEPEQRVLAPADTPFGIELHEAASSELRVRASGGADEAEQVFRSLCALRDAFPAIFAREVSFPPDCTVYALDGVGACRAFLEGHTALDESLRATFEQRDGAEIPGTSDWAWWTPDPAMRIDGLARIAFSAFLAEAFAVDFQHAFLSEGLGLWTTGVLLGTRLTWFVEPESEIDPREAYAYREVLLDPGVDWLVEARKSLEERGAPAIDVLLTRGLNELSVDEILFSHALVAYLVEAHEENAPRLLAAVGAGRPFAEAWAEVLDTSFETSAARLPRWLAETTEIESPEAEHDDASLHEAWAKLDAGQRSALLEAWTTSLDALDTLQLRTLRALLAESDEVVASAALAKPAEYYDPEVHARGDPIPRRWLAPEDPRAKAALARMDAPGDERAPRAVWRYDWGSGEIVRDGDPDDADLVFANGVLGHPPGVDLARALALRALDRGEERTILRALAHAYTDRDGNVYPGLTLYDAWQSTLEIEMPDVDALGIAHEVWNDWVTWVAPIPSSEHERLYAKIRDLYTRARAYRAPREALADVLLLAEPSSRHGFEGQRVNLHALWARHASSPATLAPVLPDAEGRERFFDEWIARCRQEAALWRTGGQRQAQLRMDARSVRASLVQALQAAGALQRPKRPTSKR